MMGFATSGDHTVMTFMSQRGNDLLYLQFNQVFVWNGQWVVPAVIDCNLLRRKSDFVFVKLINSKWDMSQKLKKGWERFIKGSNWYPHKVIKTLDVNEVTASIIKSSVNVKHPSGMVIKANGGLIVLVSV